MVHCWCKMVGMAAIPHKSKMTKMVNPKVRPTKAASPKSRGIPKGKLPPRRP